MNKIGVYTTIYSINGWINLNKEPFLAKILKQIPEDSKNLTNEKAYILGVLCGDGYTSTEYRLGLEVCDKEFADYFEYCLGKIYKQKCSRSERVRIKEKHYIVSLVSKNIVLDLQKYSKSFKTSEWIVPDDIVNSSKETKAAFIRGFADSEGSVRPRNGQAEITIHSSNKKSLISIQEILFNTFKINSTLYNKRLTMHYLGISNYYSLKKFHDEIGFIIRRKQDSLNQVLDSYKRKGLRKYSEEYKLLAMQLLKQGLNHRQIAKLLGTNHTNIYDWEKKSQLQRTI